MLKNCKTMTLSILENDLSRLSGTPPIKAGMIIKAVQNIYTY